MSEYAKQKALWDVLVAASAWEEQMCMSNRPGDGVAEAGNCNGDLVRAVRAARAALGNRQPHTSQEYAEFRLRATKASP